ncbi:hypothetical protein ACQJ5S_06380 [Helicobacter pylori]
MRSFKTICESGGEQNGGDLDQSVKKISDFYYPPFNQRQRFECSGGEQNGGDLDQSVKKISDFYYPPFNQRQRFECKGYFKLIIVEW